MRVPPPTAGPRYHGFHVGRRPDFIQGSVFACINEKLPSNALDHPQLDEISVFVRSLTLIAERVLWILKTRRHRDYYRKE